MPSTLMPWHTITSPRHDHKDFWMEPTGKTIRESQISSLHHTTTPCCTWRDAEEIELFASLNGLHCEKVTWRIHMDYFSRLRIRPLYWIITKVLKRDPQYLVVGNPSLLRFYIWLMMSEIRGLRLGKVFLLRMKINMHVLGLVKLIPSQAGNRNLRQMLEPNLVL